ncbi:SDR family NAD(P)-dependent oxidoreductase [Streptomyces johnsoniae]|uniref:SDR family oxidoreductase n=1 Tax=Streptomyces johnsoniae TaxID=3075532 RepID=A0ABU2SBD2_9ACTN|nr:SDR family oxidoreductase [Streptomyces sp. DSM 41886]MDT0445415.1 SDR family oxidoreductase [Streptomyces sp. DSM 41886]
MNDHANRAPGGELKDAVVMVTGAGSGIGRATVAALARAGALVVAAGRRERPLRETLDLAALGRARGLAVTCDITREESVSAAVDTAVSEFGRLDSAVNTAGTFGPTGLLPVSLQEDAASVMTTNLMGMWLCLKHQSRAMIETGGGAIVTTGSVASFLGHSGSPMYAATKHGVVGLTKAAALQLAPHGIRVNAVCPGSTDTPMLRELYPAEGQLTARARRAPLGRLGAPEEVAAAAVWLASPASSYVTGQALAVDGGVTAGSAAPTRTTK